MSLSPLTQAMQLAQSGMHRGAARMHSALKAVQRGNHVDAAIEQSKARTEITASTKILRLMDESLGTLIDELG